MSFTTHLTLACLGMVLLTFAVGARLLFVRVTEARQKRIHPQAMSTSLQMAAKLQNVQAADNFRNLFETPVLFYALVGIAIGSGHTPGWLAAGCWLYLALRVLHSVIHCSYNRVLHRFIAFGAGFALLVGMWVAFAMGLLGRAAT